MTPALARNFLEVIREHTAGDPQREIRWTNLRQREIAARMTAAGTPCSRRVVRQLLKQHGFVRRVAQKRRALKQHPDRNAQFEHIAALKMEFLAAGQPVISIDTKKKELLGNFYRDGKLYTREILDVLDHDFPSYSDGKVVPHGIYDIAMNKAHVNLGTSCDTTQFACDSIARWWDAHGRHDHPHASRLLILCDGGGSNPANSNLFKQDLQALTDRMGLSLRVAHYPPYCSKHNPIEHRVFPHVTRACQGVIFRSVPLVKQLIQRTRTSTGLRVTVDILNQTYVAGRKAAAEIQSTVRLIADPTLPKWNYTLQPKAQPISGS